jgi:hypothetical protein
MTTEQMEVNLADSLELVEKNDYACWEDLAEDISQDFEGLITEEQHYHIAELVEMWWTSQS